MTPHNSSTPWWKGLSRKTSHPGVEGTAKAKEKFQVCDSNDWNLGRIGDLHYFAIGGVDMYEQSPPSE